MEIAFQNKTRKSALKLLFNNFSDFLKLTKLVNINDNNLIDVG